MEYIPAPTPSDYEQHRKEVTLISQLLKDIFMPEALDKYFNPPTFIDMLRKEIAVVHEANRDKGFWESRTQLACMIGTPDDCDLEQGITQCLASIALVTSELSEAVETIRKYNGTLAPDPHVPSHPNFTVELADAVIRIFDLAAGMGLDLAGAYEAKLKYNLSRPYKHGKKV